MLHLGEHWFNHYICFGLFTTFQARSFPNQAWLVIVFTSSDFYFGMLPERALHQWFRFE